MELEPYYLYPGQFEMTAPSAKTTKEDDKFHLLRNTNTLKCTSRCLGKELTFNIHPSDI